MDAKIGKEYIISTEEFCAIDYNQERKFFLKETRPDLHEEMSKCLQKAAEIEEINDIFPETFINNTKHSIFDDNNIPEFIPIKVINKYKNTKYYICNDLICNKEFIIPNSLLQEEFTPLNMWKLDKFMISHNTDINRLINRFDEVLNPPRNIRRKSKKGTK